MGINDINLMMLLHVLLNIHLLGFSHCWPFQFNVCFICIQLGKLIVLKDIYPLQQENSLMFIRLLRDLKDYFTVPALATSWHSEMLYRLSCRIHGISKATSSLRAVVRTSPQYTISLKTLHR